VFCCEERSRPLYSTKPFTHGLDRSQWLIKLINKRSEQNAKTLVLPHRTVTRKSYIGELARKNSIYLFMVFHISIWGAWSFVWGGLSPLKHSVSTGLVLHNTKTHHDTHLCWKLHTYHTQFLSRGDCQPIAWRSHSCPTLVGCFDVRRRERRREHCPPVFSKCPSWRRLVERLPCALDSVRKNSRLQQTWKTRERSLLHRSEQRVRGSDTFRFRTTK